MNNYPEAETKNTIGSLRKSRGLKQSELAQALGCDSQTISRYETGKRDPSLAMGIRIAAYFNVSVESIFSLNEK